MAELDRIGLHLGHNFAVANHQLEIFFLIISRIAIEVVVVSLETMKRARCLCIFAGLENHVEIDAIA